MNVAVAAVFVTFSLVSSPSAYSFAPVAVTGHHNCNLNQRNGDRTALAAETTPHDDAVSHRRAFLNGGAASIAAIGGIISSSIIAPGSAAWASGGATAGKYTTIPIAKRRYYGRVQEAVHEFLLMGPDVVRGDMTSSTIQTFFDPTATVIIPAKMMSISGQCTRKDGDCRRKEIRDSRYNDMKASMYLLGNAFRINQQKAPDNLPTVQAAKQFFKEMDGMEKLVVKKPKTSDPDAQARYARALDILDRYLDLVELPPTDSGHYDKEFSTLVGESSRIT